MKDLLLLIAPKQKKHCVTKDRVPCGGWPKGRPSHCLFGSFALPPTFGRRTNLHLPPPAGEVICEPCIWLANRRGEQRRQTVPERRAAAGGRRSPAKTTKTDQGRLSANRPWSVCVVVLLMKECGLGRRSRPAPIRYIRQRANTMPGWTKTINKATSWRLMPALPRRRGAGSRGRRPRSGSAPGRARGLPPGSAR